MKKIIMTIACVFTLAAFIGTGVSAHAFTGQKYSKDAKISLAVARRIALKVFPGKIVSEELEHEKGGSGLRYSFDIRGKGGTHEVGVDAVTGKVLENSVEGPHPD
ncbi:MAG: PepSY domain-containing protein [Nitrospiraceae bacterium]|nr:PepSY domain-containing protein [Nitrospiraceae bacterium]